MSNLNSKDMEEDIFREEFNKRKKQKNFYKKLRLALLGIVGSAVLLSGAYSIDKAKDRVTSYINNRKSESKEKREYSSEIEKNVESSEVEDDNNRRYLFGPILQEVYYNPRKRIIILSDVKIKLPKSLVLENKESSEVEDSEVNVKSNTYKAFNDANNSFFVYLSHPIFGKGEMAIFDWKEYLKRNTFYETKRKDLEEIIKNSGSFDGIKRILNIEPTDQKAKYGASVNPFEFTLFYNLDGFKGFRKKIFVGDTIYCCFTGLKKEKAFRIYFERHIRPGILKSESKILSEEFDKLLEEIDLD